jgi:hypothetical protein
MVDRSEVFDEADLDTAIARFEQLSRPAPRLENAATRVYERLQAYFAARDWEAMTEILAEDVSNEDRRRVVNAGIRHGRDATMGDLLTATDIGITYMTSVVIASRGELLVLIRTHLGDDERPEAFHVDFLQIVEIDANERITVLAAFDPDDIDAAFEELDARYLAGEAAAHAHTWSVLSGIYAGLNRHELPPTTPDWVNVDRRQVVGIAGGGTRSHPSVTCGTSRPSSPSTSRLCID